MPVLTFLSGRKQYALQRISDGAIIKRNAQYPTTEDGGPIVGLDPDLRYLEMWRDVRPDEDVRIWNVVPLEVVEPAESEGPDVFHIKWSVEKRPVADIKNAAKNVESLRNKQHLPDSETVKILLFAVRILAKKIGNQTLTVKEQAVFDRVNAAHSAIAANDARLAAILAAVDNGETPDLDDEWAPAP